MAGERGALKQRRGSWARSASDDTSSIAIQLHFAFFFFKALTL